MYKNIKTIVIFSTLSCLLYSAPEIRDDITPEELSREIERRMQTLQALAGSAMPQSSQISPQLPPISLSFSEQFQKFIHDNMINILAVSAMIHAGTLTALVYLWNRTTTTIQAYKNLYNLIAILEEKISQQDALLSDEQLQNLKNAVEIARNQLSESAQDDEKLTLAYQALMLEAQKYTATIPT